MSAIREGTVAKIPKDRCFGCAACADACPTSAVSMTPDGEGFPYPQVDLARCVGCGACLRVCPSGISGDMNGGPVEPFAQRYFAAINRDENVRLASSSGGVFRALSDGVIESGGHVFGAAFTKGHSVAHVEARTIPDCVALQGSKYVQSDMSRVHRRISTLLMEGNNVLFSGTPCQTAGLRRFLEHEGAATAGLVTIDFICHGVGSPLVWDQYVVRLCKTAQSNLVSFSFRDKSYGWGNSGSKAVFSSGVEILERRKSISALTLYKTSLTTRPSCYSCPYTSYKRVSDLTLADFWNVSHVLPSLNDDKGVSTVLVNTGKGSELFGRVSGRLVTEELSKKDVWQPHLEYPKPAPKGRTAFWANWNARGAEYCIRRYGSGTAFTRASSALIPLFKVLGLYVVAGKAYRLLASRLPSRSATSRE